MSEGDAIAIFVTELIARARSLPLREALGLLRGALIVGGEHDALDEIRTAYTQLATGDEQLELIAEAQRKLLFNSRSEGKK